MMMHIAVGLIVVSPVMSHTSSASKSAARSQYFWLLSALMGDVYTTRCYGSEPSAVPDVPDVSMADAALASASASAVAAAAAPSPPPPPPPPLQRRLLAIAFPATADFPALVCADTSTVSCPPRCTSPPPAEADPARTCTASREVHVQTLLPPPLPLPVRHRGLVAALVAALAAVLVAVRAALGLGPAFAGRVANACISVGGAVPTSAAAAASPGAAAFAAAAVAATPCRRRGR